MVHEYCGGITISDFNLTRRVIRSQQACQFLHAPTNLHMATVKRILWYVQGTLSTGLKFHRSPSPTLSVFFNAYWAGCPDNRKSTSGFVVFLGANLVSWSSQK
jgi:hypothetical protein